MGQIEERLVAIARLIQTDEDAHALRLHLKELLVGPAFTTSPRSGQFLQYVVEKAVAQQTGALKERTIGVEVFHRPPNYDTGEDAIVRVTASDVRRRLAQHYSGEGRASRFRISLPPGGYAPEVYRDPVAPFASREEPSVPDNGAAESLPPQMPIPAVPFPKVYPASISKKPSAWMALGWATLLTFLLASLGLFWATRRTYGAEIGRQPPWSLMFAPGKPLLVVMADPDLNEIQLLTGRYISLSDYAAGRLGCETLQPELQAVCRRALRGDKASTVDVNAITKVAALAGSFQNTLEPLEARSVRLPDLLKDRNVLLLGSRVANPWTDLFREKLDFYVTHDDATGLQIVRNIHRRPGEAEEYVPTAGPWGSGENYTLISFLHNLSGNGYAMLLTGATHEGMDAAISFTLDENQFSRARLECRITSADEPFQMLLKFKMMAGSPLKVTAVACHRLAS